MNIKFRVLELEDDKSEPYYVIRYQMGIWPFWFTPFNDFLWWKTSVERAMMWKSHTGLHQAVKSQHAALMNMETLQQTVTEYCVKQARRKGKAKVVGEAKIDKKDIFIECI